MELALCYYRQGKFDLGRSTFLAVLSNLSPDEYEIRCLTLIRLASLERHAGRLKEALTRLDEARSIIDKLGPWASGRYYLELASTYGELAISEDNKTLFTRSLGHYQEALLQFEAVGNLRLIGITENNVGFLLLTLGSLPNAKYRLESALKIFEILRDKVRLAQVHDSIARLHLAESNFKLAAEAANRAIETLEFGDEDALFAEVLTTKGLVCCKLQQYAEAARILERAHGVSARCGDRQGAGQALLIMLEEMGSQIPQNDQWSICSRLNQLREAIQAPGLSTRVEAVLARMATMSED